MAKDLFEQIDKLIKDLEEGRLEAPEELKPLLERAVAAHNGPEELTPLQIEEWANRAAAFILGGNNYAAGVSLERKCYWDWNKKRWLPVSKSKFEGGSKQKFPAPEDFVGVETECLIDTHPEMGSDFWKQNPMCTIHVEDPKE